MNTYTPRQRRRYGPNAVFVAGGSRLSDSSPVGVQYNRLVIVMVYDRDSGEILDAEVNMLLGNIIGYLSSFFIGKNIYTDADEMVRLVQEKYLGFSQKALITAIRTICAKAIERTGPAA